MEGAIATLVVLGLMAAVVLLFRRFVRRPARVSQEDPPGVRTVVTFSGTDPELFEDDKEDEPLVGVRLFRMLCDGLTAGQIAVESRGTIQNAQRAECVVGGERFALVLEWIDRTWVASVEWVPETAAEKRHLALTQQVFAPPDGPALRQLLSALDRWLKAQPQLAHVRWFRKERWIAKDTSDPSDGPVR
ncbi:MAG TPA: hypothetical protein VMY37_37300 [Thermoguttaceae bacterium]|nr:hypothetical protein [Thermoguttaceae bacterium]